MASLKERLDEDLKTAAKAKDEVRLTLVRAVKSAIKYKEIELGSSLDDAGVIQVMGTLIKQRRDSADQFTQGNRPELAARENQEIAHLQAYLPQQLSAEELGALVDAAIAEAGAKSPKEMGAVMKLLKPRVAGRAEGKVVSEAVSARLSGK
ncbi:MAG: GatB/YqeY domain-containing protein [Deltaproteobacteria bacterium]|nr:GatB/YqeY domain-containing protein [Deltaproteobacteria bacterium]